MSWVYTKQIGGVTCDRCTTGRVTTGARLPEGWTANQWSGQHYCGKCTTARLYEEAERQAAGGAA